jgi:hypothetical protein
MIDCSSEIQAFHDEEVRLPQASQDRLRAHRRANRDRVKTGLEKNENPAPKRHVPQGSYAMFTINQEADGAYDIDDGVVFDADDLIGPNGADLSSLDARKVVLAAVTEEAFTTPPEIKPNCVRVHYAEGHHVDIPVYRERSDQSGTTYLELAGSSWRHSDPEAVTDWFNSAVIEKSPDETNGRQMRRVVRLLKKFSKSRSTWNMPSGFVLSVLVDECYSLAVCRDDESFVETIRRVHDRLVITGCVRHPIMDEDLTDEKDVRVAILKDKIGEALEELSVLSGIGCTRMQALKAWKAVFNTNFFDDAIQEEKARTQAIATSLVTKTRVQPSPWCPTDALV